MCESYSGPAKSGLIKRLTHLNSGPIKRSRLYLTYDTTIIKNDDSLLCYDVIITHQK